MSEAFQLNLIGTPELRRADGRVVELKVRKHLALLIYLVVDGRRVYPREELVDLLWPGVPEVNGRHSLSMAFSVIRSLLGSDSIRGNRSEIEFAADGLVLDLERLQRGEVLATVVVPALEIDRFL